MSDDTPSREQALRQSPPPMPPPPDVSTPGDPWPTPRPEPKPSVSNKPRWTGVSFEHKIPDGFPQPEEVRRRVDALYGSLDYDVDLIPPSWDLEIRREKSGRSQPDFEAQRVLAFLLTWHRTGSVGRGRFSGRALQVSRPLLEQRFGLTDTGVGHVLRRLEKDYQLIERYSRGRGIDMGGYIFIAPNMDRVEQITYPVVMNAATGALERAETGHTKIGGPYYLSCVRRYELAGLSLAPLHHDEGVRIVTLRHPTGPIAAANYGEQSVGGTPMPPADLEGWPPDSPTDPLPTPPGAQVFHPDLCTSTGTPTDPSGGDGHDVPGTDAPRQDPEHLASLLTTAQETCNVSTWASVHEPDRRIERQVKALAATLHHDLGRSRTAAARRAVARRAWLTAGRLQPEKRITRAVANAWDRLERRGHDPALELVELAVLACGRIHGDHEARRKACVELLNAVCREDVATDLLSHEPDEAALQTALRTALMHRMDRDNIQQRIARLCSDGTPGKRHRVFAHALVEAYSSPGVPCHSLLFAGAMAECVRNHDEPTAEDLFLACTREARALRYFPHPEGSFVRVDEPTLCLDRHPGTVSPHGANTCSREMQIVDAVWTFGGTLLTLAGGGQVPLDEVHVENPAMSNAEGYAEWCRHAPSGETPTTSQQPKQNSSYVGSTP